MLPYPDVLADIIISYVPQLKDAEALALLLRKPILILDNPGPYCPLMLFEYSIVEDGSKVQRIDSIWRKEWTRTKWGVDGLLRDMERVFSRRADVSSKRASEQLWAMICEYNGTLRRD